MLDGLTRVECNKIYLEAMELKDFRNMRRLCCRDLFFLLTVALRRKDADHDWLFDRCREVEKDPDDHLDLWPREHYKSTVITFAKTIQDILRDRELTVGIFSHTRPIAKAFLAQIKTEFEINTFLINLFPDVLYKNPSKQARKWSLDDGITVKRISNPKEQTVEAWGLVDAMPTSKHFRLMIYDDVVTKESVSTPEQINKTTDAWALSLNLGARGGQIRYIGTRYHQNDTYKAIIDRNAAKPRIHAPTNSGHDDLNVEGDPFLLTREELVKKRESMGPYIYAAQMLQNPSADKTQGFKLEWIQYYNILSARMRCNYYLLGDPAGEKKKNNDYTVLAVIALGSDQNYYLVDGLRCRMNLTERTSALMRLHRKWRPLKTGYEKYGKDSDIEHIKYVQEQEGYRFHVEPLSGPLSKLDRIKKLIPVFEQGRFYMPRRLIYQDTDGSAKDFIRQFIDDEYAMFPVCTHDDMLDDIANILHPDLGAVFPKDIEPGKNPVERQYNVMKGNHPWKKGPETVAGHRVLQTSLLGREG